MRAAVLIASIVLAGVEAPAQTMSGPRIVVLEGQQTPSLVSLYDAVALRIHECSDERLSGTEVALVVEFPASSTRTRLVRFVSGPARPSLCTYRLIVQSGAPVTTGRLVVQFRFKL